MPEWFTVGSIDLASLPPSDSERKAKLIDEASISSFGVRRAAHAIYECYYEGKVEVDIEQRTHRIDNLRKLIRRRRSQINSKAPAP